MNLIRKAGIVFAIVFAMVPVLGFAQYQHTVDPFWSNLRNPLRYEIGGGLVMPSGTFTGVVHVQGSNGVYKGDSTASRSLSSQGFGGSIGLALPFKATGHISCWAVSAQLSGNIYSWEGLNQTMGLDGSYNDADVPLNAGTMQFTMPIGIDYKIGNDAILTKRLPFAAAFGVGVMPQFAMTTLEDISGFKAQYGYGCTPYAKFDWSIFAGICWKLRFMYSMGNINLLDVNSRLGTYNDGPFTISSGSQFMVSLMFMPFSGGWKEFAWYNTYDTYNQHDRFN